MRIALYPHGRGSGIETYCRELAPQLAAAGHDPIAIGSVEPDADAVEYVSTPSPSTAVPIARQREASRHLDAALARTPADVLHLSAPPVLSFLEEAPPSVVTAWFHPPTFLGGLRTAYRSYPRPLRELPLRLAQRGVVQGLDRRGYRAASGIVSVTSELQTALDRRGLGGTYVPPGIDPDPERTWTPDPDGQVELLFVAASVANARKNFEGLLDVVAALDGELEEFVVHVAGDHGQRERRLVANRGLGDVVDLRGHVPRADLFALYEQCDCVLAPSRYEEFGYAVLEAVAHGVPVVGSDIHAFRDLLGDGAGVLSDPSDPERFAGDVLAVVQDPDRQRRLSDRARRRVREQFSWDDLVADLCDVYERILE